MKANTQQIKAFWATLSSLGMKDEKEALVLQATNHRTTSSRDMSHQEMMDLLTHLNGGPGKKPRKVNEERVRMIKKVHFLCHQMEWQKTTPDGVLLLKEGRPQIDKERLDNWCQKYGPHKQPFNDHKTDQLPKLLAVLEKVHTQTTNT